MEYLNLIISILIFIIIMIIFYWIINNFGIGGNSNSNTKQNSDVNFNTEKKIAMLKNELANIKNELEIKIATQSEQNLNKEIIIETDSLNTIPQIKNIESNIQNPVNKPPPIIYDPIANYDIAKLTDPLVDPRGRTSADQIPTPQVAMQFNIPTQGVVDRYHRVGLLIAISNDNGNENRKSKKYRSESIELPYSISDTSSIISSDDLSDSDGISGSEFIWNGPSKTNISKRKKKYNSANSDSESNSKIYRGVEIKENFDSEINSYEHFGSSNKTITNVYNTYSNSNLNDNSILELIGKKITDNWYKYFTSITMGNKIIKVVVKNKNRKELYSGDIVYIPEIKKTYRVKIDPMDMIEYNPYLF